jgi:chemotaxis protein methyltransferase CheR
LQVNSSLEKLEAALAEHYGWAISPPARSRILTAVSRKAVRLRVETAEYCHLASSSESELQALVEEAAAGETYFFREPQQYDFLRERILPELIAAHEPTTPLHLNVNNSNFGRSWLKDDRLRIWSAACSTGEEAFALAIAFDQVNPPRGNVEVDVFATDVRNRALLEASRARYHIPSMRMVSAKVRERYFERSGDYEGALLNERYTVIPAIRRLVAFRRVNLLESVFWKGIAGRFDLVVCANLLMYLSNIAARQMVDRLSRTVREGGYLMVAPAESPLVEHARLRSITDVPSFFQRTA